MSIKELQETIGKIAVPGKGILAADESVSTATKRLEAEGVKSTEESRRKYREMLFTTPHINDFLRGVILYEETLYQKTSLVIIHGIFALDPRVTFKTQAYADSLYRELTFEKAPTIEFPAPDWPGNYYQVVDTIKSYAGNYFAQLDLFPEH